MKYIAELSQGHEKLPLLQFWSYLGAAFFCTELPVPTVLHDRVDFHKNLSVLLVMTFNEERRTIWGKTEIAYICITFDLRKH